MKNPLKKSIIFVEIVWNIIWIYLIITKYSEQSIYLFISEFAVVFSTFILTSILLGIKKNKKEIFRLVIATILLSVIFMPGIYILSRSYLVLIYFGLSILFNLIGFYFLSSEEKISSFKSFIKNGIFLVLSGIIGPGILSIIVYHILKMIERAFELLGFEIIKFRCQ